MALFDDLSGFGDAGAGVGGVLGGLVGNLMGNGDRQRALREYQQMLDAYRGLNPTITAPEEQVATQGPTAFENVSEDPGVTGAQRQTLEDFRALSEHGGMDAQSRAALSQAQSATAQQERAQRGAILNDFASRGGLNSNAAVLASLASQQGMAQRGGMEGLQAAGDASTRRLGALSAAGSLAGQIRGQDYQRSGDLARARDVVAENNQRNLQGVYQRGADRNMAAQQGTFNNSLSQTNGEAGAMGNVADWYAQNGKRKANIGYGVGGAVGRIGGVAAGGL